MKKAQPVARSDEVCIAPLGQQLGADLQALLDERLAIGAQGVEGVGFVQEAGNRAPHGA